MPKEDLVKLAETLALGGYTIISFHWEQQAEPPFGWEIDLKIVKPLPKLKKKD